MCLYHRAVQAAGQDKFSVLQLAALLDIPYKGQLGRTRFFQNGIAAFGPGNGSVKHRYTPARMAKPAAIGRISPALISQSHIRHIGFKHRIR